MLIMHSNLMGELRDYSSSEISGFLYIWLKLCSNKGRSLCFLV